jgi:hypothetical protein
MSSVFTTLQQCTVAIEILTLTRQKLLASMVAFASDWQSVAKSEN